MNFQRLRGQNLLRHKQIQKILKDKNKLLIGDSISFIELFNIIFFSKKDIICHALEIYSVSYKALVSEYLARWGKIKKNPFMIIKSLIGITRGAIRVFLMKNIIAKHKMLLVSSELRKKFLEADGLNINIKVIKNKPIYKSEHLNYNSKKDIILLIGSMYENTKDFLIVNDYALSMNYKIHCYGLTNEDIKWFKYNNFNNVINFGTVDYRVIPDLLQSAKFALCLYPSNTINNQLSASSKIFEILYHGLVPIISNNKGLISELTELEASYVLVENIHNLDIKNLSNIKLFRNNLCTFNSELSKIKMIIDN